VCSGAYADTRCPMLPGLRLLPGLSSSLLPVLFLLPQLQWHRSTHYDTYGCCGDNYYGALPCTPTTLPHPFEIEHSDADFDLAPLPW